MLYFRNELSKKYNSTYKLKSGMKKGEIFKVGHGLYSDKKIVGMLERIVKKYPNAILTGDSAFYYLNLTDYIPDLYFVATSRNYTRIDDNDIKQVFIPNKLLNLGKIKMTIENVDICIYDKERMLIELIRRRKQIPFDYYKEIIRNYRRDCDNIDVYKLQKYLSYFRNEDYIFDIIQKEVF